MALDTDPGPCLACHHPRPPAGPRGSAITSLSAMDDAAGRGCVICGLLSRGLRQAVARNPVPNRVDCGDGEGVVNGDDDAVGRLRIDFNMSSSGRSLDLHLFGLGITVSASVPTKSPGLQQMLPDLPISHHVPDATSSATTLKWIEACLKTCDDHHLACRTSSQHTHNAQIRLLDLQSGDPDVVQLIDSTSQTDRYACLSHCWGHSTKVLTTLSTNLNTHKAGISLRELPLTFADTITLLREVDIRYLWIDSLCIIQDDELDWHQQAAQMATIYQNAYVVVSASKASNANDGLYSSMASEYALHSLVYSDGDFGPETVCFRRAFTHLPSYMDHRLGAKDTSFPTFNRAWILQERFLARRVIHFGSQELIWECHECTACQCRDGDILNAQTPCISFRNLNKQINHISHTKSYFSASTLSFQVEQEVQLRWHRLVEEYSKLHMSYERDIYPAISGLAQVFHACLKMQYCAGLWKENLIADLVWHPEPKYRDESSWSKRPRHWRAPTWSWASITSPATYPSDSGGFTSFCSLVDVTCVPSGQDAMGQLAYAEALIRSHVIKTTFTYRTLTEQTSKSPWNLFDLELARGRIANVWADYDCSLPGVNYLPPSSEILVMVLGEKTSSKALEALLIVPVDDSTGQCERYKRIGIVEFSRPPGLIGEGLDPWLKYLSCRSEQIEIRLL